jgi:DNA-binding NarL/FixJ family response regulator
MSARVCLPIVSSGQAVGFLWLLEEPPVREDELALAVSAAADAASAAVTFAEQFGREAETITSWPAAVIAAHRGDLGRAQALAERGLGAGALPLVAEAGFRWVLGIVELSRADARGALEHLERAEDVHEALGIFEPALQWYVPDLLDALLAAGEVERAEEMLAPFARRARELDRPWAVAVAARTEALLKAQRGDADGASTSFRDALAAHERVRDPFQHARTLLALGATQRRAKQRRAARETLEEALAIFTRLPAPLWAEKARSELARIGGRTASRGELTESERRIAGLVAEGLTNREVAAALFLTEHTVETALSRVYRKLGVRSRTELAGRLARGAEEPDSAKS